VPRPQSLGTLIGRRFHLRVGYHKHSEFDFVEGLILKQTHQQKGEYRRAAFTILTGENIGNNVRSQSSAKTLPEDAYQDFDGVDKYTIEII
jgi:hypothetical protein